MYRHFCLILLSGTKQSCYGLIWQCDIWSVIYSWCFIEQFLLSSCLFASVIQILFPGSWTDSRWVVYQGMRGYVKGTDVLPFYLSSFFLDYFLYCPSPLTLAVWAKWIPVIHLCTPCQERLCGFWVFLLSLSLYPPILGSHSSIWSQTMKTIDGSLSFARLFSHTPPFPFHALPVGSLLWTALIPATLDKLSAKTIHSCICLFIRLVILRSTTICQVY